MTDSAEKAPTKTVEWAAWATREAAALAAWAYALVKLFVYDVDVHLVERYAPHTRWLLDLKLFAFIAAFAGVWLLMGNRRFMAALAYVVCYPLVLLFWRVPVAAFRRWPVVVAFAPAIHRALATFRSTFLLYTIAMLGALFVLIARDPGLLMGAMVALGVFLVAHLSRAFRKAYVSSVFTELAGLARKLREAVERGTFDVVAKSPEPPASATPAVPAPAAADDGTSPLVGFYLLQCAAAFISEKVAQVARGRKYDFYLIVSWLYTVLVTTTVFAFEYFAVHKIDPDAFQFAAGAGFWSFYGYSMGILTTAGISPITPAAPLAGVLSYLEMAGSALMLVILVFTRLTAGREAFKEDVEDFGSELRLIAATFESRALQLFQLTMAQVEYALLEKHADMVNFVRKMRGLPELPSSSSSASTRAASEKPRPATG